MRNYDDLEGELLTDTCRQCQRAFRVREEPLDGKPVCDDCIRETVNRAALGSEFSDYLWDTALLQARMRR
jgi:hypothetical protein